MYENEKHLVRMIDQYKHEAQLERELSESIVAEREQLIIDNERLQKQLDTAKQGLERIRDYALTRETHEMVYRIANRTIFTIE